jgi:phosphate-selective porin
VAPAPVAPTPLAPLAPIAADAPLATANAVSTVPPKADDSFLAKDGHPMAGWHNGLVFFRDYHDNFRVYLQGRAQIDAYTYFGPGVSDTALKPTLFLRRIRPEITGELFHRWTFMIAGDFGATGLDNPKGTTETSAAAPGKAPSATSGKYASAETVKLSAAPTDVFINFKAHALFNAQVGQFDAPFTMENRTSDKYIPFMERSLAVRAVGVPSNKEIGLMLWGEVPNKVFYYSVGVFNGDGQNRLNTDARADFMGRAFIHPLATVTKSELKDFQIGGSFRYGSRDQKFTDYDYSALTTQGNYTFWSPTYGGTNGTTHIIPSGDQVGAAAELRLPISIVDVNSEFVYVHNNTREALEGFEATNTERLGTMKGYSYYVEVGVWAYGQRDVNGMPGYENPPHLDFSKPDPEDPPHAFQILAKWEQVKLSYASAGRLGAVDPKNMDGDIKVNAFSLGANYWWTKHIRLTTNYVINMFPGSEPGKATVAGGPQETATERAQAPGNTLATGVNDKARSGAHILHELLFRVAVAL